MGYAPGVCWGLLEVYFPSISFNKNEVTPRPETKSTKYSTGKDGIPKGN